jgi:hypothetical protein
VRPGIRNFGANSKSIASQNSAANPNIPTQYKQPFLSGDGSGIGAL